MASSSKVLVNDSQQDHGLLFEPEEFRNTTLASKVQAGMEEMRLAGIMCDVTLVAGNVDIQAHKLVLANTSQYFYSIFTGGLKEKDSSRIVMEGLDPQALTSLVQYSYTGNLVINQNNVINVFTASKMLLYNEISEACSQFLKNQLDPENCFEFKEFAKTHNQSDLISYCDNYILEHFGEIVKQEEFLKVNKEDLLVFIASDKIGVDNEEQVFDCILSWIDHDRSLRSGFLQDLMKHIRFSNISSEYLVNKIENETLIKCDNVKEAILKIL